MTQTRKLSRILKQEYPVVLNQWRLIILVSAFISSFLIIFQPFGLQFVSIPYKMLILGGYGMVTFGMLVLDVKLIPLMLKNTFREEKWTVGKQVIWLLWIVTTIGASNYVYSVYASIFPWIGFRGFFVFMAYTFFVAVIPVTVITIVSWMVYLKKYTQLSTNINEQIEEQSDYKRGNNNSVSLSSGSQTFSFHQHDIVFVEAEGNYLRIHYLEKGILNKQLIRNTLKNVSIALTSPFLFKCHRAFIVNMDYVEKADGNSQGLLLSLKNTNKQIPVSRNNIPAFKNILKKHCG